MYLDVGFRGGGEGPRFGKTMTRRNRTCTRVVEREPQRVARLHENVRRVRDGLAKLGYKCHESPTAIIPIMIGDTAEAIQKSRRLMELGVMVIAFGFIVVNLMLDLLYTVLDPRIRRA